ncbi:30S ribosomal protein S16 [Patescibacteria group bacterium]
MVKIRLARRGKKNAPFYRIVAVDSRKKRSGGVLENLGWWDPQQNKFLLDKKKVDAWVKKGAQITQGVRKLTK